MERKVAADEQAAAPTERTERRMTADEARESLARQYRIESAFVRVAQLSKILGIAAPTIYTAMREGRFFLPHRMLCSMPAVRLDDLADWYSSQEQPSPKLRRQADEKTPESIEQAQQHREARDEIIARVLARVKAKHAASDRDARAIPTAAAGARDTKRRPRPR
ncbi:hypothetical protein BTRA_3393 [Burkholderia thailandensis USAMRU Malaysia |nr:hypothetical protein BTJ_1815 [Burkholderia thailandensis E444]AIC87043.1 hypothetical protein BTRA_3393 [Burkholderia thailandensis USAMRU Malaysia \